MQIQVILDLEQVVTIAQALDPLKKAMEFNATATQSTDNERGDAFRTLRVIKSIQHTLNEDPRPKAINESGGF